MPYQVQDNEGNLLDAHLELESTGIDFFARGGSKKSGTQLNSEYGSGLRLVLARLHSAEIQLSGVWVNSARVQSLPIKERLVLSGEEFKNNPETAFTHIADRMRSVGQQKKSKGGNSTKKIRIQFENPVLKDKAQQALSLVRTNKDLGSQYRLPAEELRKVQPDHLYLALNEIRSGNLKNYGDSIGFDVFINEEETYPPKAIFGIAASLALGFDVKPKNFSGGLGSVCFSVLEDAGYKIVPKENKKQFEVFNLNDDEKNWAEGSTRLVTHLKKERASGLAKAKKSQFVKLNGHLFCEKCGLIPEEEYGGIHGNACIEVHHKTVSVSEMNEQHFTKLEDLECLCANCHRVEHTLLKVKQSISELSS